MNLTLIALLAVAAASPVAAGDDEIDPQRVSERRLGADADRERYFDTRWILPVPSAEQHLATRMQRLAKLRFDAGEGDARAEAARETESGAESTEADAGPDPDAWTRSFGDLVRAVGERRHDPAAVDALLAELEREHPDVWAQVSGALPALARTSRVYTSRWDPAEAHERDGFLQADPWSLEGRSERPWSEITGSKAVHQAATLAWSDPVTLKVVENDFTTYMDRAHTSYLRVGAVRGSVVRGEDEQGPFASLDILSESDLPFPFGTYTTLVDVLCVPGDGGTVITHVVSHSEDFHWLAGRDHWIPVRDAAGVLVATLVVREQGFDLDGVPDGDDARRTAIRSALGHLKREAEARGFDRDADFTPIPDYPVRGTP